MEGLNTDHLFASIFFPNFLYPKLLFQLVLMTYLVDCHIFSFLNKIPLCEIPHVRNMHFMGLWMGFPVAIVVKSTTCQCQRHKRRSFDPLVGKLEDSMATHSSILACRIPWTEEIGGLWDHKELDMTKAT